MVFVTMGILVGPVGLNFFDLEVRGELIHILTEVTLVVNMLGVEGHERVLAVIVLTVLLSVFAHGVSALPLSNRYGEDNEKVNWVHFRNLLYNLPQK